MRNLEIKKNAEQVKLHTHTQHLTFWEGIRRMKYELAVSDLSGFIKDNQDLNHSKKNMFEGGAKLIMVTKFDHIPDHRTDSKFVQE